MTITGAGTVVLGASQAASGNYTAATAATSFTVNPETPTLAFAAIPAETYGNLAVHGERQLGFESERLLTR